MKVTRAQVTDLSRAAPLFASYREFYGEPYDLEASTSFLASRLAQEESIVLLATEGDTVAGFAQIYPTFDSARLAPSWILNDLFVVEAARGLGAVDALLDAATALATVAGAVSITLATAHSNLRAQAVYARHGYETDEEFRHYEKRLT